MYARDGDHTLFLAMPGLKKSTFVQQMRSLGRDLITPLETFYTCIPACGSTLKVA